MKSMMMKTMKNKLHLTTVALFAVTLLTGCSGKNAPDEFMVLKNAPLSMPPGFHLTPGGPNEDLDEIIAPQDIAKRALFGEN